MEENHFCLILSIKNILGTLSILATASSKSLKFLHNVWLDFTFSLVFHKLTEGIIDIIQLNNDR